MSQFDLMSKVKNLPRQLIKFIMSQAIIYKVQSITRESGVNKRASFTKLAR